MANTCRVRSRPWRNQPISVSRVNPSGNEVWRIREILRPRRLADWYFDHTEWQLIGEIGGQQRYGDVVNLRVPFGAPFQRAVVGVAVKDRADPIAIDRLLQSARSEEGHDLRRLADDGR